MFDIGWTEMAVIALLALIVIGPKDLPRVLRTMGQWVRKARSLTREFQSGLDDMIRDAELDEAKKAVESGKNFNVKKAVQDSVDPTGELEDEGKQIEDSAKKGLQEKEWDSGAGSAGSAESETESSEPEKADAGEGEGEKRAKVVKHPHQPAPGNSVKPPAEEESAPEPEPASAESAAAETGGAKPTAKESSG
jgi:sec-independent protein translocase protein TatB